MDTTKLKKFAQFARRTLIAQVSARLDAVLDSASAARREHGKAVDDLEKAIKAADRDAVIERVAYIWFNRFCALRYMDVNNINGVRVVSPLPGAFQPEILADAKAGIIDDRVPQKTAKTIRDLLDGRAPSPDPQTEAYRALLVAICNHWHTSMPFMFEKIEDYTELLMPEDLLSNNSILAYTREAMTPDACEDVEIIGWLYQFYISEKKDEVFAGLKKNKKIEAENIPAATQLFTPHWIVRYLVENSLGRLWMLNHPASTLTEQMEYYIAPVEPETDFLRISSPEEIKICDPACGSGHMLTYAFDLLYAIYEEQGYDPSEIPALILTNNLFGIEIDERAGALAAFALTMKARGKQRRFFRKSVRPNICVLQNVRFEDQELKEYTEKVGRDLFTSELRETLGQFAEAKNFGSLIVPALKDVGEVARVVKAQDFAGNLFLNDTHNRVQRVLHMADYLSPKYHVVVANPPYMGASNANLALKKYLSDNFPSGKSDLMTAFLQRAQYFAVEKGFVGAVTLDSWMFLSSYQNFRTSLFESGSISSLVHVGWNCFPDGHAYNRGVAFIIETNIHNLRGRFMNLSDVPATVDKHQLFKKLLAAEMFFDTKTESFEKLPGQPVAYWMNESFRNAFSTMPSLGDMADFRIGMATGKNDLYVRTWHEVSSAKTALSASSRDEAEQTGMKWFPYAKGGQFRRWAGNREHVVNWEEDGYLLQTTKHPSGQRIWAHNFNLGSIFKPSVCWTQVTDAGSSFRYYPNGYLFDAAAGLGQPKEDSQIELILGILNSKVSEIVQSFLNPTRVRTH